MNIYQLVLLLSQVLFASAKLIQAPDFWYLEYYNELMETHGGGRKRLEKPKALKDLWVLDLNREFLDMVKLRTANAAEDDAFELIARPMIDSFERRQAELKEVKTENISKKWSSKPTTYVHSTDGKNRKNRYFLNSLNKNIKGEIMRTINKFVLSGHAEPDLQSLDNEDEHSSPSLVLYFRGPYTLLTAKYGDKQWNYFVTPPSPLPLWLYEKHTNVTRNGQATYVEMPEDLVKDFYAGIRSMLKKYFSSLV